MDSGLTVGDFAAAEGQDEGGSGGDEEEARGGGRCWKLIRCWLFTGSALEGVCLERSRLEGIETTSKLR